MRATARLQMPALHIRRVHTEQADTAVQEATEAAAADNLTKPRFALNVLPQRPTVIFLSSPAASACGFPRHPKYSGRSPPLFASRHRPHRLRRTNPWNYAEGGSCIHFQDTQYRLLPETYSTPRDLFLRSVRQPHITRQSSLTLLLPFSCSWYSFRQALPFLCWLKAVQSPVLRCRLPRRKWPRSSRTGTVHKARHCPPEDSLFRPGSDRRHPAYAAYPYCPGDPAPADRV